ncbi:hypothetical protein JB92DRAFT_2794788, partial [Gautieria morchelliformis]
MTFHDREQMYTRTTLHVDNLHCTSCVASIADIVAGLSGNTPIISDVDISLQDQTVSFTHPRDFNIKIVLKHLGASGFDVWWPADTAPTSVIKHSHRPKWLACLFPRATKSSRRQVSHREICSACRPSETDDSGVTPTEKQALRESRFAIEGMSCSSCTSALSNTLSPSSEPGIHSCQVTLLPPSALVVHDANMLPVDNVQALIEDTGFGAELVTSRNYSPVMAAEPGHSATTYRTTYSILGMTCASCVSSVTAAMESVPGTANVSVDLLGKTGSVVLRRREDAELVRSEIEDVGFECAIVEVSEHHKEKGVNQPTSRVVIVKVDGLSSGDCVMKVNQALVNLSQHQGFTCAPITLDHPTTEITYTPRPPSFTLRHIREEIASLGFTLSVVHVDTIEERAARARIREQRYILLRLGITFLFAIPTFIVAVVGMSLVGSNTSFRRRLEMPVWGNASEGTVILFVLATPVQLGVGWFFYQRALKSLKGVWRKRKAGADWRRVWLERLLRWGSMDTLVSLGTLTGYFASLALMIMDIRTMPVPGMMGGQMGWFDSSVFLILFILAGRYLESVSKQRTGDAIATLSSTKPSTGLLYGVDTSSTTTELADFLDVGDILLVPAGASPPLDGVLAPSSSKTTFDESSLTGEARPVLKAPGDEVFAGTTNAGPAAAVVIVTKDVGHTMLDGIVGVVRDAMGKKAGIERIADIVTGYFVPFVVFVAALTFIVWCLRGYLGDLPSDWVDSHRGGSWALFAVQFGVAVLVVACPCGIGLAAPTAQMIGVGIAAQHGILSNGGGEAFQTISSLNTVVLDKTGTLTTSKFTVSDHKMFVDASSRGLILSMLRTAEQASTHPLAVGVREWCNEQLAEEKSPASAILVSSEEIPGRGLLTTLIVEGDKLEIATGNEKLMDDVNAAYQHEAAQDDLLGWQMSGKSVVLLSAKLVAGSSQLPITSESHTILGVFGVHDPPRAEASTLIAELRQLHMDVWMISGDNPITANAVAQSVGIDKSHVVAGALPGDKLTWVRQLQTGEQQAPETYSKSWWRAEPTKRRIVAFCGDGINDAPAIAQADVGLAMGGGSSVAVSTADFCLLNSNLLSILTVHHVARATRRKIMTNFVWACLYNVALMPLAAGAFYPLGRTTLPPVWGSAAMAMSSISVVVNSLFLRWLYSPPKA